MTTPESAPTDDQLAPVRRALLEAAHAEADRLVAGAEADARAAVAAARGRADDAVERARAAGESDARAVLAGARSRARREARALVLAAQREAWAGVRDAALAEVADLPDAQERVDDALAATAPEVRALWEA